MGGAPTLPTGPTGTDTVARITRAKVGAAAKVPAPDRNGRSAQLTTTPRTTAVLAHRGRDHLEYVWPRLSLWRLSIPQPTICVRRPPNEQQYTTGTLHIICCGTRGGGLTLVGTQTTMWTRPCQGR